MFQQLINLEPITVRMEVLKLIILMEKDSKKISPKNNSKVNTIQTPGLTTVM